MIRDDDAHRQAAARLRRAKAEFSAAASLALKGDKDSAIAAALALRSVNLAMAELRELREASTTRRRA